MSGLATMEWVAVADQLPPEGVVVDTKIDDWRGLRNEQPLQRRGSLYFFDDGSMYVYYRPTHWRHRGEGTLPGSRPPLRPTVEIRSAGAYRWQVLEGGVVAGEVRWYRPGDEYRLIPEQHALSAQALRLVAAFCERETRARRAA